jgi:hypothetical protein
MRNNNNGAPLGEDLIWGAKAIALELFSSDEPKYVRKAFYLLNSGLIDAEKIGDQWVGSRQRLRRRFRHIQAA